MDDLEIFVKGTTIRILEIRKGYLSHNSANVLPLYVYRCSISQKSVEWLKLNYGHIQMKLITIGLNLNDHGYLGLITTKLEGLKNNSP